MITAKLSSKGQITLPRRVRKALDLKPGERVVFVLEDETVLLRAMGPASAKALAGSLRRYVPNRKSVGQARAATKREVARAAAQER